MKIAILTIALTTFGLISNCFAQDLPIYRQGTAYKAYRQGKDGTLLVSIETKGETMEACKLNAMKQVAFSVIFVGYAAQGEIPAASPLSDMGTFDDKKAMFEEYLNGPDVRLHVIEAQVHPSIPAEKLSKKEYRGTFVVTVNFEEMRKYLEDKKIIKAAASLGFKPSVAILPDIVWMEENNASNGNKYVTIVDNQQKKDKIYNYREALLHPLFKLTLDDFKSKFGNRFEIIGVEEKLAKIDLTEAISNQSSFQKQESPEAKIGRSLAADLWLKIYIKNDKSGLENRATVTFIGFDPYTMSDVITTTPVTVSSRDDVEKTTKAAFLGAADNISPRIFTYFKERLENGIKGTAEFNISQSLKGEVTFETEFPIGDGEAALSDIISNELGKHEKKDKDGVSRKQTDGTTDPTILKYRDIYIPLVTESALGDKVKNEFKLVGAKIKKRLASIGLTSEVLTRGLGDLVVNITGKKEN